jgi:hypothetical protein
LILKTIFKGFPKTFKAIDEKGFYNPAYPLNPPNPRAIPSPLSKNFSIN